MANFGKKRLGLAKGGDGIGLYRTEFLYLRPEGAPSEDEQYDAYRQVEASSGGPGGGQCTLAAKNEGCTTGAECCSGVCKRNGSCR